MFVQPVDYFLAVWFVLAALSTAYVAWDQFRNNPEPVVMKWGFILVTLYMGPLGLLIYVLADKEPRPGEHEAFTKPLWKQGVGSTIHCVAGDATGIILAAAITAALGLPMWIDLIVEYVAGFAFGLFIFQSLFMKSMMGGTYWENVRKSFMPEFISMNFMMAGMAPVMSFLMMGSDMRAMEPTELLFWGVMSFGVIVGLITAYPANVWMVARGLKHGLMTERKPEFDKAREGRREHAHSGAEAGVAGHRHHEEKRKPEPTGDRPSHSAHARVDEHANPGHGGAGGNPGVGHHGSGHRSTHGGAGIAAFARIGRHPLHPMLVPLPIGFFMAALLADIAYWLTASPATASAATWLIAGGVVTGAVAATAGLADFLANAEIRALYHARYHLVGNVAVLAIGAASLWLRNSVGEADTVLPWGLSMSAAVVALLAFTGWHGGEMVFGHGVGMQAHQHEAGHRVRRQGSRSGHGSAHGNGGGGSRGPYGGHGMEPDATVPQLAAFGGVSVLALALGMIAPANWVNLTLSARDVGGAIMPPGMVMDRDTPAAAMLDMAAVHPRLVTASHGLEVRGDRELQARMENGVKVFDLETSVIRWAILPDVKVDAYAINGQVPGPRLHIRQGDRVRINVTNRLPESTTLHWHGLILPNEMDGPAEITQEPIPPGGSYRYEFTAGQSGTYFYHSHDHVDRQQALGLYGALIIDPGNPQDEIAADHDYVIQLQEWLMREGLTFPSMPMDGGQPNYFTINGRAYPSTDTIRMKVGETLKVRFIGTNNGFIHPMHIHGGPFEVVARDGETIPESARFLADTVNVGPGQRYDVVWQARRPGKWLIHCHIGHHTTNNNVEEKGGGGLMVVIDVQS
ncbi:MAG: DUF4396 domain-containing protein [Mesorhizobium sp.]|nr:MAG: DUF4396 domain-containing protein [Mesorhizobium sp.]